MIIEVTTAAEDPESFMRLNGEPYPHRIQICLVNAATGLYDARVLQRWLLFCDGSPFYTEHRDDH